MTAAHDRAWRLAARTLALLGGAMGAGALAGWVTHVDALVRIAPGLSSMKPATALCLLALGVALVLDDTAPAPPARRRGARTLAALASLAACITLAEYAFGWDSGLWRHLPHDGADGPGAGRMAGATALALAALGACVLERDQRARVADAGALAAGGIALLALLGYAVDAPALYTLGGFSSLALNSAVALMALALAAVAGRPRRGLAHLVRGTDPGAQLARLLLPAVVVVPVLVLTARTQLPGLAGAAPALGAALGTVALMVMLSLIVVVSAHRLRRMDALRARHAVDAAASEARSRAAFASAAFGHALTDAEGRVLEVNDAFCALVGHTRDQVLRLGVVALTHPDDRAASAAGLAAVARGQVAHHVTEKRYLHPQRGAVWALVSITPLRDADGRISGYLRQAVDLSARKNAEAAHAALARELAEFSYAAAHDLRAPLRHVDGFAAALRERLGAALDAEGERLLGRIGLAAQRMGALVDALLGFAQLSRRTLHPAWVDAGGLARDIVAAMGAQEPPLDWRIATDAPVWADPVLLRRALAELLENARRVTAGRAPRTVWVSTRGRADGTDLEVRDDGPGYDPAQAMGLFAAFTHVPGTPSGGVGMGLAVVRRVAELHGGTATAQAGPGTGARFILSFPQPPASTGGERHAAAPDPAD